MGAKHEVNGFQDIHETTIENLFVFMGSTLECLNEVPAGNIVGIGGLDEILIKTGTLTTDPSCPNFLGMKFISQGLVKVCIEAQNLNDRQALKTGIQRLNRSDPAMEFSINSRGEYIIETSGEVHLQRILKDLKDDFCPGISFTSSDPIIPFKETIVGKQLSKRIKKKKEYENKEEESSSEEEKQLTFAEFLKQQEDKLAKA